MENGDFFPRAEKQRDCPGKMEVPTEKEKSALAAMKSIKERVRELKKLRHQVSTGRRKNAGELSDLEDELSRLKTEWNRWDKKRQEAARERMILLGHEEGP